MYIKKLIYITFLLAIPMLGIAQQWEIDFSDHEFANAVGHGVLATDGSVIAVGYIGSDNTPFNPMLLRVYPNGSYKEHDCYDIPSFNLVSPLKLNNGNYMALGATLKYDGHDYYGYELGAIVFNDSLEIVSTKTYDTDSLVAKLINAKAIVDTDGTVVVCGEYEPGSTHARPFFYRLNEDGDILDCLFEEPSNGHWTFNCYQILKDPRSDGYIVIGTNHDGQCAMAFYDRQFAKKGSVLPSHNGYMALYTEFNSEKWLSQDNMLTFGFAIDGRGHGWDLLLADINLDGTVNRYVNALNTPDTSYNIAGGRCMAVVNDTTMYGLFYLYPAFKGFGINPGVCLFNKNMEILGVHRFLDAKYNDIAPGSVIATPDGGCVLLCYKTPQYMDTDSFIIKMSREDFNPIPCSISEVPKEQLRATAYPNPTRGELNIDISNLSQNTENRVSITDMQGITRMSRIIQGSGNLLTIDVTVLETGVYFYSVYNREKEIIKEKFIKN